MSRLPLLALLLLAACGGSTVAPPPDASHYAVARPLRITNNTPLLLNKFDVWVTPPWVAYGSYWIGRHEIPAPILPGASHEWTWDQPATPAGSTLHFQALRSDPTYTAHTEIESVSTGAPLDLAFDVVTASKPR
jgi:hypothetical protein